MRQSLFHLICSFCRHAIILAAILIFAGCAGQDKPASTGHEKMAAASMLLAEAVYVSTLFNECIKLGSEAELVATTVQQDWLIKNWALIAAADEYYSVQERPSGILYNGELLSLNAIKLAYDAEQRARKELNFSQRSPNNQQKVCINRLNSLVKDEMDLSQIVDGAAAHFVISKTPVSGNINSGKIPAMAGSITPDKDPGRTHYVLNEQLKQECPQTRLLVLHSNWPQETYAVYCNNTPVTLMICEWGKCEGRAN